MSRKLILLSLLGSFILPATVYSCEIREDSESKIINPKNFHQNTSFKKRSIEGKEINKLSGVQKKLTTQKRSYRSKNSPFKASISQDNQEDKGEKNSSAIKFLDSSSLSAGRNQDIEEQAGAIPQKQESQYSRSRSNPVKAARNLAYQLFKDSTALLSDLPKNIVTSKAYIQHFDDIKNNIKEFKNLNLSYSHTAYIEGSCDPDDLTKAATLLSNIAETFKKIQNTLTNTNNRGKSSLARQNLNTLIKKSKRAQRLFSLLDASHPSSGRNITSLEGIKKHVDLLNTVLAKNDIKELRAEKGMIDID